MEVLRLNNQVLLLATQNQGKIIEIKKIVEHFPIVVRSLLEFPDIIEPEETGATFKDNARIKAKYYADKTGLIALADDSGLSIDQLNGEPGVYSARWMGVGKTYQDAFARIQHSLQEKNTTISAAHFSCAISIYSPNDDQFLDFFGEVHGQITFPARGKSGFGYDPIFVPNGYQETFAQMPSEEKNKISHRANALKQLQIFLSGQ